MINQQLGAVDNTSSIDQVMTTLLERLAIVQEDMALMQKNFQSAGNLQQLKAEISKNIDDIRGGLDDHNAGDKALKFIAQLMQSYLRQSDYVFRIGGEEFVLLLCNTDAGSASAMVEKLRDGIARSSFHFKGEPVSVTLSAGITETRPGDNVESIYERADGALHRARNSGRNCQFIAD